MKVSNLNHYHRIFTLILFAAGFCNAMSGEEPMVQAELPDSIRLNGEWDFKLVPDAVSARQLQDFYMEEFDASGFETITVPSNWALMGFEEPRYVNGSEAEGFYLRTFILPESAKDIRAILHFDGVWVSAEVWLNGINLGRHDSGFTAFGFDISNELLAGEENHLAVRVRQQIPASLFKFDANDDWGLAGIFRDVRIEFSPKHLYIEKVEVNTDLDDHFEDADLKVRVFVARNERDHYIAPSAPFDVRATLLEADGSPVQSLTEEITVAGGHNGRDTHLTMRVQEPRLWTAETPELYRLQVEIIRNGLTVHKWEDTIGFREISTEGGIFRVNGKAVKLRGVASHDLHPDTGRATTREQWLKDIHLMKAANINTVRLAHYPHAEGFIRLCDELGLYVLDEIPLGFGGDRMADPIFASGMLLRIHETIQRDRNRPSVIVWSFGNEDGLTYLHTVGLRAIKGIDPSRPVLLPFRASPELPPEVDILAPHYWNAVDYDKLAASATRPIISTEYTHAMGLEGLGELEDRWSSLTRHASGAGAMIWLWADQGLLRNIDGKPVFDPMKDKSSYTREGGELVRQSDAGPNAIYDAHGNYGTDGIVNPDRSLTHDYFEAKAVYAPVEILVESIDMNRGQEVVHIPVYNGYDFTNLSAVEFEWKLYRNNEVIDTGFLQEEAAPHERVKLDIPTGLVSGSDIYYVHLKVLRQDGSEMTSYSVRLNIQESIGNVNTLSNPIKVRTKSGIVSVRVGDIEYGFNKKSGEIETISKGGEVYAESADLIVWRKSTYNERNRYDRRENQHDWDTFMQGIEAEGLSWKVDEQSDKVVIHAKSLYQEDSLNKVTVDYLYTISDAGQLDVEMAVSPEMDIPELPEIGIVLAVSRQLESIAWLGEGPGTSQPGKNSATIFGWWEAAVKSANAYGTKWAPEWARLRYESGPTLQVLGADGIRLEEEDDSLQLRILTHLGGAWTKNGPPEYPDWHLDLEPGKTFNGSFRIQFQNEDK